MSVNKASDDFIRIQDFVRIFIRKWYWYVLSLLITMSVAVFYLLKTPSIYTRTASILLKNDSENGRNAGLSEFSELSIFRTNVNINNELFTLKSPMLMLEVVKRLGLNELFLTEKGLQRVELYKTSPFNVIDKEGKLNQGTSFLVKLTSPTNYVITRWMDSEKTLSGTIGKPLRTPAGEIVLSATPYLTDEYIGKEILYIKGNIESTANAYAGALRVALNDENTTIVHISISDASTQKAEDILNALIEVYNEKWIQDKNQITVSTSQFINERLGIIEGELGNVDDNISSFKSTHLIPDVQTASGIYLSQSVENKRLQSDLSAQLSLANYIRTELETKSIRQLLPVNSGIKGNNIEGQIDEYNAKVLERNQLISNSSERHPLVQDLARTLQSMKGNILSSVDNLIVSLNTQMKNIQRQQSATTGQLASNPNRAKYLLSVERQQKVKEALYLYLLQKREENELSQAFTAYNTRVVSTPHGSNFPTAPKKNKILLMAFALGMLIPTVFLFLKEIMNTKVRGRKDLSLLNIPFAGEIPYCISLKRKRFSRKKVSENSVVVQEGNRNVINEAFRVLRSNIDFMTVGGESSKVFILTSFNPGSGKSFLTLNLAISFAIKGKKILVIDGDLRHGSLSVHIGSPKKGLNNYLGNHIENWKDVIVQDEQYVNLHYLPVGVVPPNPTELLEKKMFDNLIKEVRSQYDYIFIDCPPVDIVADTQIIEKNSDCTLFIVRANLLDRTMLSDLEEIYQTKRFKNLSVVLNGTAANGSRYGYHYGYYGSYYSKNDE